ncbi:MAG: phage tail assembly chaperone, partial [Enterobacteriaceae bacterium]
MKTETFTIGNRQFTATKMNAFDAGRFLLKLNRSFAPALLESGQYASGNGINLFEMLLGMDENMHEELIFPILAAAHTYSLDDNRKLNSAIDLNICFSVDNLFDFYL